MAQTYEPGDKVVVVSGPDEGREATVVDNFGDIPQAVKNVIGPMETAKIPIQK